MQSTHLRPWRRRRDSETERKDPAHSSAALDCSDNIAITNTLISQPHQQPAKSSQQQYKLFKARCTASIRQKFFAWQSNKCLQCTTIYCKYCIFKCFFRNSIEKIDSSSFLVFLQYFTCVTVTVLWKLFRAAVTVLVRPCCPARCRCICRSAYCRIIGRIKWWWWWWTGTLLTTYMLGDMTWRFPWLTHRWD